MPPPYPRLTIRSIPVILLGWMAYAVALALLLVGSGEIETLGRALWSSSISGAIIVPLWVGAWVITVQHMDARPGWQRLLVHLVLGPLTSVVAFWVYTYTVAVLQDVSVEAVLDYFGAPFWMQVSTTLHYAIFFAVLHGMRARRKLRWREEEAARLIALAQERELAALKSQLNPHFLFNALNTVSATLGGDPETSRRLLRHLADLLRYTLDSARRDLVPLRDELAITEAYLALERERFSDRLRVEIDVPEAALGALVPPLALQTLAENAITHGIAPSETGGLVRVTARVDAAVDLLHVSVEDTGVGVRDFDLGGDGAVAERAAEFSGESAGIGLANTRARLTRLLGESATLIAGPRDGGGFRAAFTVPVRAEAVIA